MLTLLGIRQSRYFGRAKTLFQILLAATVANLTLVASRLGFPEKPNHHGPSGPFLISGEVATSRNKPQHLYRFISVTWSILALTNQTFRPDF